MMAHRLLTSSLQTRPRRTLMAILPGLFILLSFAALAVSTRSHGAASLLGALAQETLSGTWTADAGRDQADGKIQFSFFRRTERGHSSNSGSNYLLSDFQGLTRAAVFSSANTPVSFRLVREAGTIECEGSFRDGKGSGSWRLIPSQDFRAAMRSRGYDNLTDEQMFTSVMLNLTAKFVDDLKAAGFDRLSFHDVLKALIFKVTPEFVAEMKALGFEGLGLEDLVKARIFKVDADFARQVRTMGFDAEPLEQLVKLRIFKVTPEFLKEMKAEGLSLASVEDAVKLRIFKVDADFIRRARASGHTDLSVEELVRLRIHNRVK
jgi:hypothetical protein